VKPYQTILIEECGEPLVAIPLEKFAVEFPHPYQKLGADYGGRSPYYLRQSAIEALLQAQDLLQQIYRGWKIKIFDAYRPVMVQQFMVDYTFTSLLQQRNLDIKTLSPQEIAAMWEEVYQLWAIPSYDPQTPPPHSTGGAVDITLVDRQGNTIDMGGEIDEVSERSHPDYYRDRDREYHQNREILNRVMTEAGFLRHRGEWWHFSLGDQMWAWLKTKNSQPMIARYGRIN
jgi:D-alanyl-D-alanine dipeptidase